MAAKVICVASAKGGSGKTIFTAALGHLLAAMEKRVLIVDTDAATNGLSLLYLNEMVSHRERMLVEHPDGKGPAGIFDLARGRGQACEVPLDLGVAFLPATYRAQNTEDVAVGDFADAMRETVAGAIGKNDFVLLDAQAGSDPIAQVSMKSQVSDQVVLVSEYDPLSAAGVERLKSLFPEDLAFERTWILVNKMLPEFASSLGDFLQVARYLPPIPWDADVVRAYAERRLALDLAYGNDYTLAVISVAKALLGPTMSEEIDAWLDSRAAALKAPIKRQLRDLEIESRGLVIEQANRERHQANIRVRRVSLIAAVVLVASIAVVFATGDFAAPFAFVLAPAGILLYALREELFGKPRNARWKVRETDLDSQKKDLERRMGTLRVLVESEPTELLESQTKVPRVRS